ncbi:hypothetical protein N9259_00795 [bacterium]|nr:hypothetical protein [bacterium]
MGGPVPLGGIAKNSKIKIQLHAGGDFPTMKGNTTRVIGVFYHGGVQAEPVKQPPFSPIRSGPKAASKPSRQKQIPSSHKAGLLSDEGLGAVLENFLLLTAASQNKLKPLPFKKNLAFKKKKITNWYSRNAARILGLLK